MRETTYTQNMWLPSPCDKLDDPELDSPGKFSSICSMTVTHERCVSGADSVDDSFAAGKITVKIGVVPCVNGRTTLAYGICSLKLWLSMSAML